MDTRMKHRRPGRLAASAVSLLTAAALLFALAGCKRKDDEDEKKAASGLADRAKATVEELAAGMDDMTAARQDVSVEMTLTARLADGNARNEQINGYLQGSSLGLMMENRDKLIRYAGDVSVRGETFLSGAASFDLDSGELIFQVPELDDTHYIIELYDDLRQTEDGEEMLELFRQQMALAQEGMDLPTDKLVSVAERYIDVVAETATKKNCTKDSGTFTLEKLGGRDVKGKSVTFRPTAEDIEALLLRLADEMEDDRELREMLMELVSANPAYRAMLIGELENMDQELAEEMAETAVKLRENAAEVGEEIAQAEPTVTFWEGGDAFRLEASAREDEETYAYYLEGCDAGFAFWLEGEGETPMEIVAQWEESGGATDGSVAFRSDDGADDVEFTLTFEDVTDRLSDLGIAHGKYTLEIFGLGRIYLDVTENGGGTDHIITLDIPTLSTYCRQEDMGFDLNGMALTFHTTDQPARIPDFTGPARTLDLVNMDSDELDAIFAPWGERLEERAQRLGEDLGLARSGATDPQSDPALW